MPWERNTLSVEKQETLIDKEAPAKNKKNNNKNTSRPWRVGLNAMFQF